ncbi:MAG TPA: hypothetical protein VF240_05830 [Pyrinomonadaceae bacterium]
MNSLSLHSSSVKEAVDLESEVARLEAALAGRRAELTALQDGLREFKTRYAQVVGSRLAELAEVEKAIREAEGRVLGVEREPEEEEAETDFYGGQDASAAPVGKSLRRLFWSVAKMFHPDHAADEGEARRRHTVMAEASRAYREGDVESLHTLLGDEGLQSFCTGAQPDEDPEDLGARALRLELELRTIEFGIKRIRLDALYRLKLEIEAEAARGRDALTLSAERIDRQIVKARRRLENLS